MLALLKRKLYAFGGYRLDMGGDSGGGAPAADPLVGQAAKQSADLADQVYADNKEWLGELKPILRENMATQTAASKLAYDQSKTDVADYNTYGRTAMQRQAIGHGLLNYVSPEERSALYDLYASKGDSVRANQAATAASGTGLGTVTTSAAPAAATAQAAAGGAGTGGLINYNGKLYSPNEFTSLVQGSMGSMGPNSGMVTNSGISLANTLPGADEALKAAGYSFNGNGVVQAASTPGTTSGPVTSSGGYPTQSTTATVASSGTGGKAQLDALLKSSGVSYVAPKYNVSYKISDGTTATESPEKAIASINKWAGTSNKAAAFNIESKRKALEAAGYKLTKNEDGTYAFDGDPKEQFATITKAKKDAYDTQVETIAQKAGIKTDSVLKAAEATNDKAIFNAETGLVDKAVATESQRAADAAGTDATQAISKNNAMMLRQAGGMTGFDPNKFARVAASTGVNLGNTAMMAGGVNAARENARREVIAADGAGTANTINTTRGLASQSINFANSGQSQGNSAASNGTAAITANNAAAAPAFQGWGQAGQLMNTSFTNQSNAWNAQQSNRNQESAGLGSMIGMIGRGALTYFGGPAGAAASKAMSGNIWD